MLIMAIAILARVAVVVANLVVDLSYAVIDPRVRARQAEIVTSWHHRSRLLARRPFSPSHQLPLTMSTNDRTLPAPFTPAP